MSVFTRKEIKVDEKLSNMFGFPIGAQVSYSDLTKKLYDYINSNQLRMTSQSQRKGEQQTSIIAQQFCFNCGSRLPMGSKFCDTCGSMQ